jgi:hypothetical protein
MAAARQRARFDLGFVRTDRSRARRTEWLKGLRSGHFQRRRDPDDLHQRHVPLSPLNLAM